MTRFVVLACIAVFVSACFQFPQNAAAQTTYSLKVTPKTVAWGYYDAKAAPVLRVKSGDSGEIQTPGASATPNQEKPIIYVRHLESPLRYPVLARQTRCSGTILIKLAIAADGRVLSTESSAGDSNTTGFSILKDDSERIVKTWTFGCVGCSPNAPFEHTIRFNYRLDNEDILPNNLVVMNLPDDVTIYGSLPICDHCPAPKTSKKGSH